MKKDIVPIERIARSILYLRDQKVMLDSDLATLYGVEARVLNQAVKRNRERFPDDFMFQLSPKELQVVSQLLAPAGEEHSGRTNSSQFVMSSRKHRGRRYRPYAFTHVREKAARYRPRNHQ